MAALDIGIPPSDQHLLLTGATGLPPNSVDTRLPNATSLPNGPYQLTPGIPYDAYTGDPVHRFFQMWQQMDCSVRHASADNPSGCLNDLFAWVEVTVGRGGDGKPRPADFSDLSTGEGSAAMGFYNVNNNDAPYLKQLADTYAMSDNYHQPVAGGTGANHVMLGTGDAIWYSDGKGNAAIPPQEQIENPNPQVGTNNYYIQDGYAGGSYVACADPTQPGVAPIINYLNSLPSKPKPNCDRGTTIWLTIIFPGFWVTVLSTPGATLCHPRSSRPSAMPYSKRIYRSDTTVRAGMLIYATLAAVCIVRFATSCNTLRQS